MKPAATILLTLGVAAGLCASTAAQRPDYLSKEEVQKVRDTVEPQDRIELFLDYALDRLARLESELRKAGSDPRKRYSELVERFDHYTRAIDDVAAHLEMWLERGGADLRNLRKHFPKKTEEIQERLRAIPVNHPMLLTTDLKYDYEDALEATEEMVALGPRIPDTVLPATVGDSEGNRKKADEVRDPGKPTLKRKEETKEGQKPPPVPPPSR